VLSPEKHRCHLAQNNIQNIKGGDKLQQEKYDAVVIGSGVGGLCAGALLSHWGYRALMVERLGQIGGRWSTEEYNGFKLATGAVMLHYRGTVVEEIFKEVGAEFEGFEISRIVYRLGGEDWELPSKGGIAAGIDMINKLVENKVKVLGGFARAIAKEKVTGAMGRVAKGEKAEGTFKDWLLQYTDNPLLHDLFDTMLGDLAARHSYEVSASGAFAFFSRGGAHGICLAPRGNIVNAENLAKVIRANGDVWVDSPVKSIVVKGKEAKGVIVQRNGGEVEVSCQVVVSNIGPKATAELVGEENLDEEYLKTIRVRLRPQPITLCYVASDRPIWPETGAPGLLMTTGTRRMSAVIPMSSFCPELAPPGQHLLFLVGVPETFEVPMIPEVERELLLLDLKEQFPLFEKHGRILKITHKNIDDELPGERTGTDRMMSTETPLSNLYSVGDAVCSPGYVGTLGSADSSKRVADTVRKRFKPGKS